MCLVENWLQIRDFWFCSTPSSVCVCVFNTDSACSEELLCYICFCLVNSVGWCQMRANFDIKLRSGVCVCGCGKGERGSKVAWLFCTLSKCSYSQCCFTFIFCLWSKSDHYCPEMWPVQARIYYCGKWCILLLGAVIGHILIVQSVPRCQVTFGTNSECCLGKLILIFKQCSTFFFPPDKMLYLPGYLSNSGIFYFLNDGILF